MDISTVWVGDHFSPPIEAHAHRKNYQLIYCQKGKGIITVGQTDFPVVPGHGYLIQPKQLHAITPHGMLRLSEVKFAVSCEDFAASLSQLPTEFEVDDSTSLRLALKDAIREGLTDSIYSREATDAALYLFLIRLLRKNNITAACEPWSNFYYDTKKRHVPVAQSMQDADFALLLDYIENNLSEQITLDSLAETVHFEKSHLAARFKEQWGISPIRYVNYLRIEQAKLLLATSDQSVTEIAKAVGFASIHYFSRYFKEKEGVTPVEYRQQQQKSAAQSL